MKKIYTLTLIGLLLLLALPSMADDSSSNRVKLDDSKLTFKSDGVHKPLWYDDKVSADQDKTPDTEPSESVHKFSGRYALVGSHCMINRSYATVSVGSVSKHLDYLTDDTLTNSTTMYDVAGVGVGYKPVVSVRDLEHHFAKGTTAGFCLASTSTSILSLDVGQTYVINFYREGKWVGMQSATAGKNIQGLNLKLISLPSADECVINIEASAPAEFDEIEFGYAGAAKVDVASMIKLKYAFVGDDHTYTLTTRSGGPNSEKDKKRKDIEDFFDYCTDNGIDIAQTSANVTHDYSMLGLKDKVTNSDLTDGFTLVLPLSVVWGGEMSVWSYAGAQQGELFKKGSVVGYNFGTAGLDVKLINAVRLELLDQNGNVIKGTAKTIGANLLTVGLGGGNNTVSMEAGQDFSGVKITFLSTGLGASGKKIYYAFVKEAPKLFPDAHHCPIEASADMNMCTWENSVTLSHNPDVPVTWAVTNYPSKGTSKDVAPVINQETQEVTGMNDDGTYEFTATSQLDNKCTEVVTIKRGDPAQEFSCETQLDNTNTAVATGSASGGGGLLSITDWQKDHPVSYVVDGQSDTYAEYKVNVGIAKNVRVLTIKTSDDNKSFRDLMIDKVKADAEEANKKITDSSKKIDVDAEVAEAKKDSMCIGFVVSTPGTVLNLNLLQGFRIECYDKDGNKLYGSEFTSQSNVLGLTLVDGQQVRKYEVSAVVPADKNFYSFSLWSSGVLDVSVQDLRIYYPFYERGSEVANCSNPIGCSDAMQINNVSTGAKVSTGGLDSNKSGSIGTVNVSNLIQNLSFAVDDDPDYKTYMTCGGLVDVATGYQVGIKMGRTLDNRHQLVIVMDAPNNILTARVGNWMTIQTYYKGKATGDKKTNWSVLGVDLLKAGDKAYYMMSPTTDYDEVLITFAGVANVADYHRIYGIAVQSDIDGDGIPDCKDGNSCSKPQVKDVKMPPTCQNSSAKITWTGKQGQANKYHIALPGQMTTKFDTSSDKYKNYITSTAITGDNEYCTYTFTVPRDTLKNYGNNFTVRILDLKDSLLGSGTSIVHPLITHWKKNAPNTNWNEWGNWAEGSPYYCSDVIIPSDAVQFPELTDMTSDQQKNLPDSDRINWNNCNNIHFCPDAAVENVYKLTYTKAWVDLGLKNGIYRMYMAPLKSVYSGDFFVSSQPEKNYFVDLTDDNDKENRTAPFVYQRLWDKCLSGVQIPMTSSNGIGTGEDVSLMANEATWSNAFNALSHDYSATTTSSKTTIAPDCFTLMVKDEANINKADSTYVIHLPKAGSRTYYYYDYSSNPIGEAQKITHASNAYKLWGDWTVGTGITLHYLLDSSTSYEKTAGSKVFLVGNPLMSHLNLGPFINGNTNVNGVKVYDGNTTYSVIAVGSKLVSTNDTNDKGGALYVGPSQAFFIETNDTKTSAFEVDYTESMYGSQPTDYSQTYHSGNTAQSSSAKALTTSDDEPAYLRVKASNGQNKVSTILLQGIDQKATTLIDEKYKPTLAAFSMEGNQAYDIRPVDADVIDLGFYTANSSNVQLSFETSGNFDADAWRLYDRSTGNCYRLDETPVVTMEGANVGRFYLSRIGAVTKIHQAKAADGVSLNVAEGIATVKSDANDLTAVYVYDESGSLVDEKQLSNASQATLHVAPGVNIVKVCRAGKADKSYKVMGR